MAFARAATEPTMEQAGQQAQAALAAAYMAADELVKAYMEQVFQIRQQRQPVLPTALGCRLYTSVPSDDSSAELIKSFNSVALPLAWKEVEHTEGGQLHWEAHDALLAWATAQALKVSAGPVFAKMPSSGVAFSRSR